MFTNCPLCALPAIVIDTTWDGTETLVHLECSNPEHDEVVLTESRYRELTESIPLQ